METKKRIRPLTDDGTNKYRPACKNVEWIAFVTDKPNNSRKRTRVTAQTWFVARNLASIALGVEPGLITVNQVQIKKKKHKKNYLMTCLPIHQQP